MVECVGLFENTKLLLTFNTSSDYWQSEVDKEDWKKTAFISQRGLYQYIRMSFGLKDAPWMVQRLIDVMSSAVRW